MLRTSVVGLVALACSAHSLAEYGVSLHRGAFTKSECDKIIELMRKRPADRDVRPSESVSRINYFDMTDMRFSNNDGECPYDWIYERILQKAKKDYSAGVDAVQWGFDMATASKQSFSRNLDFVLMHEFRGNDFFDWHVDTKPGDGTGRTVNVNVMLSDPSNYQGGGLLVGGCNVRPSQGDLYFYPANFPHKVEDVTGGTRHTLVLAVKTSEPARAASSYWARGEANFRRLTQGPTALAAAAAALAASSPAGLPVESFRPPSKWHHLFGETLAAQGRDAEADSCFADSYAATDEAPLYAARFDEDGQRLVAAGQLAEALPYFSMAAAIDARAPVEPLYAQHRDAIAAALRRQRAPKGQL